MFLCNFSGSFKGIFDVVQLTLVHVIFEAALLVVTYAGLWAT